MLSEYLHVQIYIDIINRLCHMSVTRKPVILCMPQSSWNTAEVDIKHQPINQPDILCNCLEFSKPWGEIKYSL